MPKRQHPEKAFFILEKHTDLHKKNLLHKGKRVNKKNENKLSLYRHNQFLVIWNSNVPVPTAGRFPDLYINIQSSLPSYPVTFLQLRSALYSLLTVTRSYRIHTCFSFNRYKYTGTCCFSYSIIKQSIALNIYSFKLFLIFLQRRY